MGAADRQSRPHRCCSQDQVPDDRSRQGNRDIGARIDAAMEPSIRRPPSEACYRRRLCFRTTRVPAAPQETLRIDVSSALQQRVT